jgi:ATP-binding cassette, subfamily F, member 2
MTSVRHDLVSDLPTSLTIYVYSAGLIKQVAKELWEVKDKKIRNLTKEDISIIDYKKILMRESKYNPFHVMIDAFFHAK